MPGWIKTDCIIQSDPHLCCKHPGEFVIFSCFYSLVLILKLAHCEYIIRNKLVFSFIVLKETINNRT